MGSNATGRLHRRLREQTESDRQEAVCVVRLSKHARVECLREGTPQATQMWRHLMWRPEARGARARLE